MRSLCTGGTPLMFISLLALSISDAKSQVIPEVKLSVARACDNATASDKKVLLSEAPALTPRTGPPIRCVVKGTSVDLMAVSVRAIDNRFNTGSVEIQLTEQSKLDWSMIEATHVGVLMALVRGETAVLEFRITKAMNDSKLIFDAPDMDEARTVARVLRGE